MMKKIRIDLILKSYAAAVQRAVRYDDIVFEVKFSKCYILLPKTDINGAQTDF